MSAKTVEQEKKITTVGDRIGMAGIMLLFVAGLGLVFVNILWPVVTLIAKYAMRGDLVAILLAIAFVGAAITIAGVITDAAIRSRRK